MSDTHTLLLRNTPLDVIEAAVEALPDHAVDVIVYPDADYVDAGPLRLSQYDSEVALVGDPEEELRLGVALRDKLPGSLLVRNMQAVVA